MRHLSTLEVARMPLKRVVAVLFIMLLPVIGAAGKDSEAAVNSDVEKNLRQQESAWNRHDLDAFMTGYVNSSDLTYFAGAQVTPGWQSTRQRLRSAYRCQGRR